MPFTKNRIEVIGNVGKDPEFKNSNGTEWVSFTVAQTNKGYTTKDGRQIPDKTNWFSCTGFGNVVEFIRKFVAKGDRVEVVGEMDSREVTNQDGSKTTYWGIVVREVYPFSSKKDTQQQQQQTSPFAPQPTQQTMSEKESLEEAFKNYVPQPLPF